MKVLNVSAHDLHGGASRAAFRLHHALRGIGVDSSMLVQQRLSDDPDVSGRSGLSGRVASGVRSRLDRLPLLRYPERSQLWFSPSWLPGSGILDKINSSVADIVHLHWINGGMMRIEDIQQIEKPIVWTLHDMWPMTGGCHYDNGCGRFKESCGACPQLSSESLRDLSSWIFDRKMHSFGTHTRLHLVASSRWMAEQLALSPILRDQPSTVLPNPLDCEVFAPADRIPARKRLGLPVDSRLILFGAVRPDDPIKGFHHLTAALDHIKSIPGAALVIFGEVNSGDLPDPGLPVYHVGSVQEETQLRDLYSSADVFVVPSVQDNLPLVATESLACGTPVVAFNATGLPDIVDHYETGYLAAAYDVMDLATGITWVLDSDRSALRAETRRRAVDRYDQRVVAPRFESLYRYVLTA